MTNASKLWSALVIVVVCGLGGVWLEMAPREQSVSTPVGSLARAVQEACDPTRIGSFAGEALRDAVTCRDLAAQESMALSTERLIWLSWLQIALALSGTVAILWTLRVSVRSVDLTREALTHQQIATRKQLRPSLTPNGAEIALLPDGRSRVTLRFENTGSSTARDFRHALIWKVVPIDERESQLDPDELRIPERSSNLPRSADSGFGFTLNRRSADRLAAGSHVLQTAYCATYADDLGGKYLYTFSRIFWTRDLSAYRSLSGFEFTDPALVDREV